MKSCQREFLRSRNFIYIRKHWVKRCHCLLLGGVPSPSLVGDVPFSLNWPSRLRHVALMTRDECASSGTLGQWPLSCGIPVLPQEERTQFLLEICSSPTFPFTGSPDFCWYWLLYLLPSCFSPGNMQQTSNLLVGYKTSCSLTLIDDYRKNQLGYWRLLCINDHRAYRAKVGRHSADQKWFWRDSRAARRRIIVG